ncbi:REP-associated tyrosine transposase [Cerasicoccus fimbriatus]|uniref:REP-associated tyrosine transposase n=1 Tax=Cerasicoccus fimbriatus TaxID=3014554 RepID=UPI0022B31540|nr:transposase [Cerasicoccus sp. TK19100]
MPSKPEINWPHAPVHRLTERGAYFVTAATYRKQHFFADSKRLDVLQRGLLKLTHDYGWHLEAWAVFSNHYHFVAQSPLDPATLSAMLRTLHAKTASWVNQLDRESGRKVWHNFRETRLTYQKSYLARLNYVHQNAVKHGLVRVANQYAWCSAPWFESTADKEMIRTIYEIATDQVTVDDNFEVTR